MEKAIDIKRRAQRCVQNNDLDGALKEYEKLIAVQDSDPYNFVLLADLLFKKGNQSEAAQRYITAIEAYEKSTLYKNAIAVGKKMMRLSLSPTLVLRKLAALHVLDGLGTEAALYYQQYAESLIRDGRMPDAADALRKGFEASPENIKLLERLADVLGMEGDDEGAGRTLAEAAVHYQSAGRLQDADRCRVRASTLSGGRVPEIGGASGAAPPVLEVEAPGASVAVDGPAGFEVERSHFTSVSDGTEDGAENGAPPLDLEPAATSPGPETPVSPDINHSMEMLPETPGDRPIGPPALDPIDLPAAPERPDEPVSAGPPPLAPAPVHAVEPESPPAPGLDFETPASVPAHPPAAIPEPAATAPPAGPPAPAAPAPPAAEPADGDTQHVERLLREAREQFRRGERDAASQTLVRAARLYDEMGQFDSAATIYRNLGRSTHAPSEVMTMWLRNCEARNDRVEAAQVACELGDRSLNDGDMSAARDWFRRAHTLDGNNETAKRRLNRLDGPRGPGIATQAPATEMGEGRVEIAVGRSEAVTFDLGSLVSEFQRGVESQISGDPQGHYDLGMAYREMGLMEQAIESFRAAARDPGFAQRCSEMIGRSMLDQGRFEEAAQEFIVALELPGLSPEGTNDLRFQLGLAYEAAGRGREALDEFERVYAVSPSYPDVAVKIRTLRQAMGSG